MLPPGCMLTDARGCAAQRASVDRKIPRVSSFPRVASAENLPSKKRLADGEAPPLVNGHRRKRTPQAADV